jgi:TldD protein
VANQTRVDAYDRVVEAALEAARLAGLYVIVRIQDSVDRRLTLVDGGVERQRTTTLAGLGVHAFTQDGAVGFASVDDLRPESARDAVRHAGQLGWAARELGAARSMAPFGLGGIGRARLADTLPRPSDPGVSGGSGDLIQRLIDAQSDLPEIAVGAERTVRTTYHVVDEQWRIARSDGTDLSFGTPHAVTRHELSGRLDGALVRASAAVSGLDGSVIVSGEALAKVERRLRRSVRNAISAHGAAPPVAGSYRLVLEPALAKGLAHEAIGHLCESDVDGSVLMRQGRLRLGEQLARPSVSVVDGPLAGDYVQQPVSANGVPRATVRLVDRGVLRGGLGDPFSHAEAGIPDASACRAASFRDRPTPRMTNIRIEIADAAPLNVDPDLLTADDVALALRRPGLLDRRKPTLYLTGYRGGQAHPRRGDFVFGAGAAYDLTEGGAPRGPVSFSGLAERALASIVAGVGPLCTDAIGTCGKDGSQVTSSGGSHALLVLDPDPDLVITAAS